MFLEQGLKMENLLDDYEFEDENVVDIAKEIEDMRSRTKLNYIECVVEVCEKFDLDIESIGQHIPKHIKEKIEADALELNLLSYKLNTLI